MTITLVETTALPTPPSKDRPSFFAAEADAFLGGLPDFQDELNANIVELNKITSGLDQAEPIAAYAAGTTYDFPDVCAGSDGYTYRCVDTGVIGDNPVGSVTGNWVKLAVTPKGNQTIEDVKTFTSSPLVPTPTGSDNSQKAAPTAFVKAYHDPTKLDVAGTTTDDDADAGEIGEYKSVIQITPQYATSGVIKNITSLELTAGDWELCGSFGLQSGIGTVVYFAEAGFSLTSSGANAFGRRASSIISVDGVAITTSASGSPSCTVPVTRFSLDATTTVYLNGLAIFYAGTIGFFGSVTARRVR